MQKVRVGGVHEYTNILFIYGLMRGYFKESDIDLQWLIYPSGSAPLAKALIDDELDLAVILTDSAIKSVASGSSIKLISPYVLSPLDWVFHVMKDSKISNKLDMIGKRFAISRFGSGGHLISLYWLNQMGCSIKDITFVQVNDMEGAALALQNNLADVFPWERLTTLKYVESGLFKEVNNITTPYSPFSIAASEKILSEQPSVIKKLLGVIQRCAIEFKALDNAVNIISATYHRNIEEVKKSFSVLKWAESSRFKNGEIDKVVSVLLDTGAIESNIYQEDIVRYVF